MEATPLSLVLFRPYRPETDKDFIFSSWTRSYRKSPNTAVLDDHAYYARQQFVIEQILERPDTRVVIATSSEDPDLIYGYAVSEGPDLLHWVLVKPSFRDFGIGWALVKEALWNIKQSDCDRPLYYTHWTTTAHNILRHFRKTHHRPNLIDGKKL